MADDKNLHRNIDLTGECKITIMCILQMQIFSLWVDTII